MAHYRKTQHNTTANRIICKQNNLTIIKQNNLKLQALIRDNLETQREIAELKQNNLELQATVQRLKRGVLL